MAQTLEAVFENGVLRLLGEPGVPLVEGQRVRLTVEMEAEDVLTLAGEVYTGLSEEEIEDVERVALERRPLFGERTA